MTIIPHIEETRRLTNEKYRTWFRETQIPKSYTPNLHVYFNFCVLFVGMCWCFFQIQSWGLANVGVLVFNLFFGNITVWIIHKYPLHHRWKIWTMPYDSHTVSHHRFFTSDFITYEDQRDYYIIFFPMFVVAGFTVVVQPLFYLAALTVTGSTDLAFTFIGSTAGYFLLYETFHWASHLPTTHVLIRFVPFFRYMRQHHLVHHNPRLMNKYNFCIVDPFFDFALGTKYKGGLPKDDPEDHFQDVNSFLK